MFKPKKLYFGTAGIPLSTPKSSTLEGIKRVRELNLDSMELEFVHGINLSFEKAKEINIQRKESNVVLTAHAPYYINLNAREKVKLEASKKRILDTAKIGYEAGAYSITFHPAFYMKQEKSFVYNKVFEAIKEISKELKEESVDIWIRPELTGKPTQFGDLDEIVSLSRDIENVLPCFDFAHYHARYNGRNNTQEEFRESLGFIEKELGRFALDNMHVHISGINYTEKGERNHLTLRESDMNWKDLLNVWKEFKIKGVVVSESPNIEDDAILLKKYWETI